MNDRLNEYDVTAYVTVAVTAHGVKAESAAHAAMTWGAALAEEIEWRSRLLEQEFSFRFDDVDYAGNVEVPDGGGGIEGYTVFDGSGDSVEFDKNGNEVLETVRD